MHLGRTTLSKFLIQQLEGIEGSRDLGALLIDVAAAVKARDVALALRWYEKAAEQGDVEAGVALERCRHELTLHRSGATASVEQGAGSLGTHTTVPAGPATQTAN